MLLVLQKSEKELHWNAQRIPSILYKPIWNLFRGNPFGICLEETHSSLEASWAKWVRDIYLYLSVLNSTFSLILMRAFLFNFAT